jgi:hypothetical protein
MADVNMHRLFQGTVSWVFRPLRFKFVETFEFKIRLPIEYAAGVLIDVCQETLDSEVFRMWLFAWLFISGNWKPSKAFRLDCSLTILTSSCIM